MKNSIKKFIDILEKKQTENVLEDLLQEENITVEQAEEFVKGYEFAFDLAILLVKENEELFK